jgi:hypothetical protein
MYAEHVRLCTQFKMTLPPPLSGNEIGKFTLYIWVSMLIYPVTPVACS